MKHIKYTFNCFLIGLAAVMLLATPGVQAGQTTRVSVSSADVEGNNDSYSPAISADGRYIAFSSWAGNLVAGDTNGSDVFVHDRVTGKTTLVSVSSEGVQGNNFSDFPAISADGRYVAFASDADNLVADDTNGASDVFVRDRLTGSTTLVSVSSERVQANSFSNFPTISADGRFVAFSSNANNLVAGDTNRSGDAFVHDRVTGSTTRVSVSSEGVEGENYGSHLPFFSANSLLRAISADGRYLAFSSKADNLVAGDTNRAMDAFVHDRVTGSTTRVSVSSAGVQGGSDSIPESISADGRYVVFSSSSPYLVAGDTNGWLDEFIHDRLTGATTRVSVTSSGVQVGRGSFPGAISADGRYVTFNYKNNVFVHDRKTGNTSALTFGARGYGGPAILSADGRYVTFDSTQQHLVAGDTNNHSDVFVIDRLLNTNYVADLQATVTTKPASVKKGHTASYTFTAKNNGPDSADRVVLTDIVSNGTVLSITPSQGTCSKAAISVCRLDALAAGASATVAVTIRADASSLRQKISVSATPKDNALSNNTVWISTPVIIP